MLNGVTGAAEVTTVAVDSIEIGALKFENQNLPVIFTSIMGNADGILGVAGFEDQRIDVDFKRDRVSVLDIERPPPSLQHGDGARRSETTTA